jgi:hypothetical protein
MAEVQTLEQRFESISVQDQNLDVNTAVAAQHKQKVLSFIYTSSHDSMLTEQRRALSPTPSP